jgi:outer membrane protein assembly factor BamD (BamD/ComL family)
MFKKWAEPIWADFSLKNSKKIIKISSQFNRFQNMIKNYPKVHFVFQYLHYGKLIYFKLLEDEILCLSEIIKLKKR